MVGWEPRVVECRSCPRRRGMARLASCRKARGGMVRIGGALIVGFVARVTVRGHSRVVVVYMATGAGHGSVRSG